MNASAPDFKKTPSIKAALRAEVDPDELTPQLTSEPFAVRGHKRIAVKVDACPRQRR